MSIRSIKRNIAKNVANENGLKANNKYVPRLENGKTDDTAIAKSGTKIAFEYAVKKEKKIINLFEE